MRIHSVTLKNFRAVEHLVLDNLPETGVILVHGDNEAGKSTILDAIDLVLRERHTAGGQKIKVFAPAGRDVGPEVELTATVGETTFTIHKRWLKSKSATLSFQSPKRATLTGREADDELKRILEESMDTNLAQTLFLRQGDLEPGIAAAGIPSISKALDAEAGGEHSGEEDTALMQAVEDEYARYWTAAAKLKSAYKAKFDAVDEAKENLDQANALVKDLAGYVDKVARSEATIREVETDLPEAREELAQREAEFAHASQLQEKAAAASEEENRAKLAVDRAAQDVSARETLRGRVEQLRKDEADMRGQLEPAREAAEKERGKIAELTAAVEAAKSHVGEARNGVKGAEAARDYVRATRRLGVVDDQLERIAKAEEAYAALLEKAPAHEVTDKDIRALENAQNEVALQRRLRDAASAKLDITAVGATIEVDGSPVSVDGTTQVAVFEGTTLKLDNFQVVFRAAQGAEDPRAAVEKAEQAYADALAKTDCADIDEARGARDAFKAHAAEVKAARQRRDDALAGADAKELRAERTRLAAQIDEVAETLDTAEIAELSETDADAALKQAQKALSAAERDVEQAEAALKPYSERSAAEALMKVETRLEAKQGETASAAAELEKAEQAATEESLTRALAAAHEAEQNAKDAAAAVRAELAEADPELAQVLLKGAQSRLDNLEERKAEAKNLITEMSGRIEIATGAAEKADRAAAELDAAETDLKRTQRRADAVKLLRETLHAHRDAARARYTAPFTEAVRNRARTLFGPSVDFNVGEDLTISERIVDGVTVPLTELSGGTKEQLALLTRFAIADLVTESGSTTPAPVVIDDALGATDAHRLAHMNTLFSQVGESSQVLVLTCFPKRFDYINPAKKVSMDELKIQAAD